METCNHSPSSKIVVSGNPFRVQCLMCQPFKLAGYQHDEFGPIPEDDIPLGEQPKEVETTWWVRQFAKQGIEDPCLSLEPKEIREVQEEKPAQKTGPDLSKFTTFQDKI